MTINSTDIPPKDNSTTEHSQLVKDSEANIIKTTNPQSTIARATHVSKSNEQKIEPKENMKESLKTETSTTLSWGQCLKNSRELLGLEIKEVSMRLRLPERIITMLEEEHYPDNLPTPFIRGYMRAYGKLLNIPEWAVDEAVKSVQAPQHKKYGPALISYPLAVKRQNYFMHLFTFLTFCTLIILVGSWIWTHPSYTPHLSYKNPPIVKPAKAMPAPSSAPTPTILPKAPQPENLNFSPIAKIKTKAPLNTEIFEENDSDSDTIRATEDNDFL